MDVAISAFGIAKVPEKLQCKDDLLICFLKLSASLLYFRDMLRFQKLRKVVRFFKAQKEIALLKRQKGGVSRLRVSGERIQMGNCLKPFCASRSLHIRLICFELSILFDIQWIIET